MRFIVYRYDNKAVDTAAMHIDEENVRETDRPEEAFPFLTMQGRKLQAALVGAGGKSTLLKMLSETAAALGRKTLVYTTTRMYAPRKELWAGAYREAAELWERGQSVWIGIPLQGVEGKITAPEETLRRRLTQEADVVLTEADGAKHHSCKVPREYEPVILPEMDLVMGVFGLDALELPLAECCFHPEEVLKFLGEDSVCGDMVLTPKQAAKILLSEAGTAKNSGDRHYQVILNKCDTPKRRCLAEALREEMEVLDPGHHIYEAVIFASFI